MSSEGVKKAWNLLMSNKILTPGNHSFIAQEFAEGAKEMIIKTLEHARIAQDYGGDFYEGLQAMYLEELQHCLDKYKK